MKRLIAAVCIAMNVLALSPAAEAARRPVSPGDDAFDVFLKASEGGAAIKGSDVKQNRRTSTGSVTSSPTVRYEYRSPCDSGVGNPNTGAGVCPASPCPPGSVQYRQWQVAAGGETPLGFVCSGNGAPPAVAAAAPLPPQVTDAMVLAAFRRVPVPELRSQSQPGDKTLVNFDTIFFTEAEPLTRTVTILGQSVRLEIEPSSFTWEHGDGTSTTTRGPGAPYPAKDVVHRYADAHVTVQHRVVVTWSAQWSLNNGPLQPVAGTVTTAGPATPLRVAEASPSLSGQR